MHARSEDAIEAPKPVVATTAEYEIVASHDPTKMENDVFAKASSPAGLMDAVNAKAAPGEGISGVESDVQPAVEVQADCLGIPEGDAVTDVCDVCQGDGTSCLDCNGVPNGGANLDDCEVCDDNDANDCRMDCTGTRLERDSPEFKRMDRCFVCGGTNECTDCAGRPYGRSRVDQCDKCDALLSNDCIEDCQGVWGGLVLSDNTTRCCKMEVDPCGVCGGACKLPEPEPEPIPEPAPPEPAPEPPICLDCLSNVEVAAIVVSAGFVSIIGVAVSYVFFLKARTPAFGATGHRDTFQRDVRL